MGLFREDVQRSGDDSVILWAPRYLRPPSRRLSVTLVPGVGKTLAAEVVGFETGKPLKVINCAELVSKWVGETGKNIEAIFKEARNLDCILVGFQRMME